MPAPIDNIVQQLFHQPSLQSVTLDELERMAVQHPYFAAAHFLLLKKMQESGYPLFNKQLHKTTLYFNNPLWLQFLLQPEITTNYKVSEKVPFINSEQPLPEIPAAEENNSENHLQAANQSVEDASVSAATDQYKINENAIDNPAQTIVEESMATTAYTAIPVAQTDATPPLFEEPVFIALLQAENSPAIYNGHTSSEAGESLVVEADAAAPAITALASVPEQNTIPTPEIDSLGADANNGNISEAVVAADAAAPAITALASVPEQNNIPPPEIDSLGADANSSSLAIRETPEEADATEVPATVTSGADIPFLKTIIETTAAQSDILFEPYHTVDYFASQGIKLSKIEADGKDRLGRQLKSFTEWLKTMKKLPQVSINKMLAENEESKVVADAVHSLENKEVITEAMAEVFEKQGLHQKAVEVYQKLSLLNPGKSTYFAAKIDILKQ